MEDCASLIRPTRWFESREVRAGNFVVLYTKIGEEIHKSMSVDIIPTSSGGAGAERHGL
jgi:hypothetical protein